MTTPKTLRLILGDQLTHDVSALDGLKPAHDIVLMVEVADEASYVPHHKQKLVLILSAMRHFAAELQAKGVGVDYVRLDDPDNTGSFTGELKRAIARHSPDGIVVTEPGEYRVEAMMRDWSGQFGLPLDIREDDRFLCSRGRFVRWAADRKSLRMEFFYREMRRETGLLMQGDKPEGDRWNFDAENRKSLPKTVSLPKRQRFEPDAITQEVMALVAQKFPDNFGDLEPFGWAVTRADALEALEHFVRVCLPKFGDYQDAMKTGEPFIFHAILSPYLNIGLLTAHELCLAAEQAYRKGDAELNAVEGFVRQILGWREYVRGIYWMKMPDYAQSNFLNATRPLPWFYWSGKTDLNCMTQAIRDTRENAYAHHIQRLMVTGNFALLAGIDPQQIEAWYLAVYADAFEWVELPNTHGMVMFADGGYLASKPYAASGAYINRMSDYCNGCRHDPKIKSGPKACPFNYLYWNFIIENKARLQKNPRMSLPYRGLNAMRIERQNEIVQEAQAFLDGLSNVPETSLAPTQLKLKI